jgi:hypothetical protein
MSRGALTLNGLASDALHMSNTGEEQWRDG